MSDTQSSDQNRQLQLESRRKLDHVTRYAQGHGITGSVTVELYFHEGFLNKLRTTINEFTADSPPKNRNSA